MADLTGPAGGLGLQLPSPLEELQDGRLPGGVRLFLKRDDLISPEVPGNKWRKLKYNLAAAGLQGHETLLTFGGAYSNHLRATAAVGHYLGLSTVGVVRGEEHLPLNASLQYAAGRGMRLIYLDRSAYRRKSSPEYLSALHAAVGDFYLLPEGGTNALALRGCAELIAEIDIEFDVICCACGTGGTLAGLAAGLRERQRALGFAVLKGAEFLGPEVDALHRQAYGRSFGNWTLEHGFHGGGFARRNVEQDRFAADFEQRHGIVLDWVYVGKMMYGIYQLARLGAFRPGTVLVAVITG